MQRDTERHRQTDRQTEREREREYDDDDDDVFLLNEFQLAWSRMTGWNAALPTSTLPLHPRIPLSLSVVYCEAISRALCPASYYYLSLIPPSPQSLFTHFVGAEILFPLRRVNPSPLSSERRPFRFIRRGREGAGRVRYSQ